MLPIAGGGGAQLAGGVQPEGEEPSSLLGSLVRAWLEPLQSSLLAAKAGGVEHLVLFFLLTSWVGVLLGYFIVTLMTLEPRQPPQPWPQRPPHQRQNRVLVRLTRRALHNTTAGG